MDTERFGRFCNITEWQASDKPHANIHCLTKEENNGLLIATEAGISSGVAALITLALIAHNVWVRITRRPTRRWKLFAGPADVYLFFIFWGDLVTSAGFALNIPWIIEGKVYIGATCTAQGATRQIGEVVVAILTLTMALHTFIVLWLDRGQRNLLVPWLAVGLAFLFGVLSVTIGIVRYKNAEQPFEAPSPYWCWIGSDYLALWLALQYVIIWACLAVSFILYMALSLLVRGNITRDMSSLWRFTLHRRRQDAQFDVNSLRAMVFYPLAYSVNVIPLSVVRWIGLSPHNRSPPAAFFVASSMFGLTGVFNVALFFLTRHDMLLFGPNEAAGNNVLPPPVAAPTPPARRPRLPRAPSLTPSTQSEEGEGLMPRRNTFSSPVASSSAPPTASSSTPFMWPMEELQYQARSDHPRVNADPPQETLDWAQERRREKRAMRASA